MAEREPNDRIGGHRRRVRIGIDIVSDGQMSTPAGDCPGDLSATGEKAADMRGQVSWALFEFARSPYLSLIYIYIFPTYFSTTIIGDPVRGQELWSFANAMVGVFVALLAPLLGAIADRTGRRKPWLAVIVIAMAGSCIALWWAVPGADGGLPVSMILALVILLATLFQFSDMFQNAMLPSIASPQRIGGLSGLGISVGNAGTLVALIVMLLYVALPASGVTLSGMLPGEPLFGLDPEKQEHNRIAGPFAGIWFLIFVIPMFLWTPDRKGTNVRPRQAVGAGIRQLWLTIKRARRVANVGLFLLARMIYTDGKVAILAYAGIYASGIFNWDLPTMLLFAILLTPSAIAGGLLGGWIDDRFGSKRAIQLSLSLTFVGMLGAISITPEELFFFIDLDRAGRAAVWSFPYLQTLPEILYVVTFMILSATVTAAFGNSRTMLARIAPVTMMSQFFGLYGLAGTATSFLGHGLVATFTRSYQSQRAGFSSILILLFLGLVLMCWVREERAEGFLEDEKS